MIVTLTLNPTIDVSTSVPMVLPVQKLRCEHPRYEPGGGGINVSRAIAHIGGHSLALYLRGGTSGDELDKLLLNEEIDIHPIACQSRTRENFIVVETNTGRQFRFGMPGEAVVKGEWLHVLDELSKLASKMTYLVVSGSIPQGIPDDFYARLSALAAKEGFRLVADTSGEHLKQVINGGAYLVKPNKDELAELTGIDAEHSHELEEAAMELLQMGKIEILLVSLGDKGAMSVTKNGVEHVSPPHVKVSSTVGAGDSMVGGVIWSLSQGFPLSDAVKMGVSCGTAATMNDGTGLCKKKDVDKIYGWLKKNG